MACNGQLVRNNHLFITAYYSSRLWLNGIIQVDIAWDGLLTRLSYNLGAYAPSKKLVLLINFFYVIFLKEFIYLYYSSFTFSLYLFNNIINIIETKISSLTNLENLVTYKQCYLYNLRTRDLLSSETCI